MFLLFAFGFVFFSEDRKSFSFFALLVSIDHSISRHRPRKPSQKFNMCDFVRACRPLLRRLGSLVIIGAASSAVVRPANICMETRLCHSETQHGLFLVSLYFYKGY